MKYPKCQTENLENSRFCSQCAEPLESMAEKFRKKDAAVETLQKAFDMGYSDPYFPMIIPAFQPIRFEPEFRAVFGIERNRH